MQTCQIPLCHLSPSSLLDSICWSISDPTSTASIYMDSSSVEDTNQQSTSVFFDAKEDHKASEASFVNPSRPLSESEKAELILKTNFLPYCFQLIDFPKWVHVPGPSLVKKGSCVYRKTCPVER